MNIPVISCGIVVESKGSILLGHATRTPRWDIPKGRMDPGETPTETALREAQEEFGIDFSKYEMLDLGLHDYIPYKKRLHLFKIVLPEPLDLTNCVCTTYIEKEGGRYPEMDQFKWIPLAEAGSVLGKSMYALFQKLNVCENESRPEKKFKP